MLNKDVVQKAIQIYGEAQQYIQTSEEVGELLTKLSQYRRGRVGKEDVVEELADVIIMFDCLKEMLYISDFELTDMIEKKYKKFERQVNEDSND